MTAPKRITVDEMRAAIREAKAADASRVMFDNGRIVIDLKGEIDGGDKPSKARREDDWDDAA